MANKQMAEPIKRKTTAALPEKTYIELVSYCAETRRDQQDVIADALDLYFRLKKQPQRSAAA